VGTLRGRDKGTRVDVVRGASSGPLVAFVAPLLGLIYILLISLLGIPAVICYLGCRVSIKGLRERQGATTRSSQDAIQSRTMTTELREFLSASGEGAASELVLIDRDLRIKDFLGIEPPLSQCQVHALIGRHCFEVLHGRDTPCSSVPHFCPVREVFQTGVSTTRTHSHLRQYRGITNDILVEISASPVKDAQGEVTFVAESIKDVVIG
jgi:hypothetical protein